MWFDRELCLDVKDGAGQIAFRRFRCGKNPRHFEFRGPHGEPVEPIEERVQKGRGWHGSFFRFVDSTTGQTVETQSTFFSTWARPETKAKASKSHKASWTPKRRKRHGKRVKQSWANSPQKRHENQSDISKEQWRKRKAALAEAEATKAKLAEAERIAAAEAEAAKVAAAEAEATKLKLQKQLATAEAEVDRVQSDQQGQDAKIANAVEQAIPQFKWLFSLPEIMRNPRLSLDNWAHPAPACSEHLLPVRHQAAVDS
jgi:hypothetical protein